MRGAIPAFPHIHRDSFTIYIIIFFVRNVIMLLKNTYVHHKRHICMDRVISVCATYRMRRVCDTRFNVAYSADRPVALGRRVRKATGDRCWII